jgi:hypothetical protein
MTHNISYIYYNTFFSIKTQTNMHLNNKTTILISFGNVIK